MNIWILTGILLAIKIIVFLAILLPMRKKLRFYTKKFFVKSLRLTATFERLNTIVIKEMYRELESRKGPVEGYRNEHYYALSATFQAVVNRHLIHHIEKCKKYGDILLVWEDLKRLNFEIKYHIEPHIIREANYHLISRIDSCIAEFAKVQDPMDVFRELKKIKKEVAIVMNGANATVTIDHILKLERKYLEQLAGLLITTELTLDRAMVVADFCGSVSRDDHNEVVSKIQNVITSILKQNFQSIILQKYPWIEDKK